VDPWSLVNLGAPRLFEELALAHADGSYVRLLEKMARIDVQKEVAKRFKLMQRYLDERTTRLWAGVEALSLGRGGRELVARATGLSRTTVIIGMREVRAKKPPPDLVKVRRKGGGGKRIEVKQPGIYEALEALVEPVARGDPQSPLRWTSKSTRALSAELLK
jgi:hypothetical protein